MVRANVNEDTVIEAENGSYYLFKGILNNNPIYQSDFKIAATDTSDGISVTSVGSGSNPLVSFAVHEAPTHIHSFTYAASGATITATCTATGCTLPPSTEGGTDHVATLTIAANGGTYDGTTAYGATITDTYSIQGDAKVQYQKKTGETYGTATETAPTDAGTYKASITLGEATASVEYTIAQADPTVTAPTGLTATYGQTLADVSLEGKNPEGNTPGTWAWVDSTQSVGNVVTPAATFKATFTPTSSNYKTVENVEVTVKVYSATAVAEVIDANGNASIYENLIAATGAWWNMDGGTTLKLLNDVETEGSVNFNGGISSDPKVFDLNGHGILNNGYNPEGSPVLFVNKNTFLKIQDSNSSKKHYVSLSEGRGIAVSDVASSGAIEVSGGYISGGYNGSKSNGGGIWIEPGSGVTMTGGTILGNKAAYGGGVYVTSSSSFVMTGGTISQNTATIGGGVYSTGSFTNNGGSVTGNYPDEITITPAAKSLTYNGSAQELVTAGAATGGTMQYALGNDSTTAPTDGWGTSVPAAVDAGTYYVWYKVVVDENHSDTAAACVTVMISKADPIPHDNLTATAKYGQKLGEASLVIPLDPTPTPGEWTWVNPNVSVGDIGTHTFEINFIPDDNVNYNSLSNKPVTVTVGKGDNPATVKPSAVVKTGGVEIDLSANVARNGATGEVTYDFWQDKTQGCSLNGSKLTSGAITGTVYIVVTVAGDNLYNESGQLFIEVTIAESPIKPIEGNGFVWHKGSSDNSSIRFSSNTEQDLASEASLISVTVDGTLLKKGTQYETAPGSVYVKFAKSYLDTLGVGTHNVVAKFSTYSDGVNATFTVAAKPSSGGSTSKKDNVVTCQMAGFPANYAWNEAAKACQPGYLDAGGNFHSYSNAKRSTVPNTSDNGNLTFYTIAMFLMTLVAFVTAKTLTEDSTL